MNKIDKAHLKGYMCAVANLLNSHGLFVEAKDLLAAYGNVSPGYMRKNGVDEDDIQTIINHDLFLTHE